MKIAVWIAGLKLNLRMYDEFADGLVESLIALGHEAKLVRGEVTPAGVKLIVLGAQFLNRELPADAIIFNSEQLPPKPPWDFSVAYLQLLRRHVVWDYSSANLASLVLIGGRRGVLCRFGYASSMERIKPVVSMTDHSVEDIDVLHYGSINDRRGQVLTALLEKIPAAQVSAVYGAERDNLIARAKVVLNMHYIWPNPIFEIFRVGHLLANRKCVVAESGGRDPEVEAFAARATCLVHRESLVSCCVELAGDPVMRQQMADRGYEEFKKILLVNEVERALGETL